ncbi:MAG: hypothetical protein ABIW82_12900 [Dokdonella sp.]
MNRSRISLVAGALLVSLTAAALLRPGEAGYQPAPTESEPGESGPQFRSQRKAWIESLHRHAPDLDWRAQDAVWRGERLLRTQHDRDEKIATGASPDRLLDVATAAISGTWRERGSSNQAGRVTNAIFDAAHNRLVTLSQGGNLWAADRASLQWSSLNDSASFVSSGFLERSTTGTSERLLVAGDSPAGLYYSDNGGASFSASTGLSLANPWYTAGLAIRDVSGSDVYLMRVHYDFGTSRWRPNLFASVNRGTSFTSLGFVGETDRVALFSPRYGSTETYLLADATLSSIVPGTQALQTISTVPFSPPVAGGDRIALSGGVSGGQIFLYAFRSRGDQTDVLRSLDGGMSWQARGTVPQGLFRSSSVATSTRDPAQVFLGGVNVYRSSDGATSWTLVSGWGDYYGDPANKLHADIPNIEVWLDASNQERVLICTDGGLYESTDYLASVKNLSLNGLYVSQYYSTYTGTSGQIFAGAQDQGYQKSLAPGSGVPSFAQTISGDYGHLDSSNGGAALWLVYPGFVMLDANTTAAGQSNLKFWNFGDNNLQGALWLPPVAADPSSATKAMLAGGSIGGGSHHIVRLDLSGSTISATEDTFDFTSAVTALAYSGNGGERYAVNSDRKFFRDTGSGWSNTASSLPGNHYFYGNTIISDPVRANTLYVAGAGYSNPAVFVSTNDSTSFTAMSNGLPSTLVYQLAISPDGAHLFAATELGPFYYDRSASTWQDLSGLSAPDQVYWDVDWVDQAGGYARFATYGRGIWDFVPTVDLIFRNGFEAP